MSPRLRCSIAYVNVRAQQSYDRLSVPRGYMLAIGLGGGGGGVNSDLLGATVRMLMSGLRGYEALAANAVWKSSWVKESVL